MDNVDNVDNEGPKAGVEELECIAVEEPSGVGMLSLPFRVVAGGKVFSVSKMSNGTFEADLTWVSSTAISRGYFRGPCSIHTSLKSALVWLLRQAVRP